KLIKRLKSRRRSGSISVTKGLSMKFFLLLFIISNVAFADDPKLYTEKDFVKKVNDEVKKKVDTIKNKSVSDYTKELLDKEEKLRLREIELQKQQDSLKVSENELAKKY